MFVTRFPHVVTSPLAALRSLWTFKFNLDPLKYCTTPDSEHPALSNAYLNLGAALNPDQVLNQDEVWGEYMCAALISLYAPTPSLAQLV